MSCRSGIVLSHCELHFECVSGYSHHSGIVLGCIVCMELVHAGKAVMVVVMVRNCAVTVSLAYCLVIIIA